MRLWINNCIQPQLRIAANIMPSPPFPMQRMNPSHLKMLSSTIIFLALYMENAVVKLERKKGSCG